MKTGPQIECQRCTLPILLAFAQTLGDRRSLTCLVCAHPHVWDVIDVRDPNGGSQAALGSSVE